MLRQKNCHPAGKRSKWELTEQAAALLENTERKVENAHDPEDSDKR